MANLQEINETLTDLTNEFSNFYNTEKLNNFFKIRNDYNQTLVDLKVLLYKVNSTISNFSKKLSIEVITEIYQEVIERLNNAFIETGESVVEYLKKFDSELNTLCAKLKNTMQELSQERKTLSKNEIEFGEKQAIKKEEMLDGKNKIAYAIVNNFLNNNASTISMNGVIKENVFPNYVDNFEYRNVKSSANEIIETTKTDMFKIVEEQFSNEPEVVKSYKEVLSQKIEDIQENVSASEFNVELIEALYGYYKDYVEQNFKLFNLVASNYKTDEPEIVD